MTGFDRGPCPWGTRRRPQGRGELELPVFDRGTFAPVDPELRTGLGAKSTGAEMHAAVRRVASDSHLGVVVTGRVLGDPRPGRAGQAPECEDSRRVEETKEAYRLLGREPPLSDRYALLDLDAVKAEAERLKPRRYRPQFKDAAE